MLENVAKHVGQLGRSRSDESVTVICECADERCRTPLAVPFAEYSRARSRRPRRFVVAIGHEHAGADVVVERLSGHCLVERALD